VLKVIAETKSDELTGQTDGHDGGRRVNILSPSVTADSELTVLKKDLKLLEEKRDKEEDNPTIQYSFFFSNFCRIVSYCGKNAQLCRI